MLSRSGPAKVDRAAAAGAQSQTRTLNLQKVGAKFPRSAEASRSSQPPSHRSFLTSPVLRDWEQHAVGA